jgi:hypothetical protein
VIRIGFLMFMTVREYNAEQAKATELGEAVGAIRAREQFYAEQEPPRRRVRRRPGYLRVIRGGAA